MSTDLERWLADQPGLDGFDKAEIRRILNVPAHLRLVDPSRLSYNDARRIAIADRFEFIREMHRRADLIAEELARDLGLPPGFRIVFDGDSGTDGGSERPAEPPDRAQNG